MEFKEDNQIEKIDTITIYKMIDSLLRYDYFSTKCLVEVFIEKRCNEEEQKILYKIKNLLFENKIESLKELLKSQIKLEEEKQKK